MSAHIRGNNKPVSRISMSLPETLLCDLDRMVEERGFDSRSQAIADMLYQSLVEHKSDVGQDVMVGVVRCSTTIPSQAFRSSLPTCNFATSPKSSVRCTSI